MGAHSILIRRLGVNRAAEMILRGSVFTAEEMYDWGIVHPCRTRRGVRTVQKYIEKNTRRHRSHLAVYGGSASSILFPWKNWNRSSSYGQMQLSA